MEMDDFAKVVVDLEARLKELESRMEEFEEELLMYKKEVVQQHEKGFHKVVRQAGFFTKDLDLGLFDPFKDVKDNVLLEEEDISTEEEQDIEEQGDEANVWVSFCLFSSFLGFWWK